MSVAIIDRLRSRMDKEIGHCIALLNDRNLVYVALKKEQISQRYFRLIQKAMRRG